MVEQGGASVRRAVLGLPSSILGVLGGPFAFAQGRLWREVPLRSHCHLSGSCLLAQILTRRKPLEDKYVVLTRSHKATKLGDHFRSALLCDLGGFV
jgi:hypothetical protein